MSVAVLKAVWGSQDGYVFIPRRKPVKGAKDKWEEGKAYKYPEEWHEIKDKVISSAKDGWDTYWCPLVFDKPKRLKECVKPTQALLWADLDFVDPTKLDTLRPSIAWKSSEERFQALWALDSAEKILDIEKVNRDLTYHIGADKGGWDVTQVLRVPGSPNYKYDPPQQGKMLWAEKRIFKLKAVAETVKSEAIAKEEMLTDIDTLIEGWKLPPRTLDLLHVDEREVEVGDRSDRLWEIETSLLEVGMPVLTIVQIIAQCPWNKFKGRKDEMSQIYSEVLKADLHVKDRIKKIELPEPLDPEAEKLKEQSWAIPFDRFVSMHIDKPDWLVEGIWQKGTYGMIAGEPKTYKSVQATDLALSVASGRPFLNHFPVKTQGSVLYVQEENNPQTVQDRIYKIAAAKGLLTSTSMGWALPENLPLFFSNNYGIDLTSKESRKLLEETIRKINPILIILDPLYMMLGTVDENSAKEVGDVLRWLTYLRNQYGCAILICHHYNKGGGTNTRGGQRVRGSSAFHAWVESALYVKTTEKLYTVDVEREFRAFQAMGDFSVKIELGSPGELYYNTTVEAIKSEDGILSDAKDLKREELLATLSTPRTLAELEGTLKLSRRVLQKMLESLMAERKITKSDDSGGKGKKVTYISVS